MDGHRIGCFREQFYTPYTVGMAWQHGVMVMSV